MNASLKLIRIKMECGSLDSSAEEEKKCVIGPTKKKR